MKDTKQTSEGADVLLADFYLLTAILVIVQALYPNFRGLKFFAHGFPSAKSMKVSSRESLYAYGIWLASTTIDILYYYGTTVLLWYYCTAMVLLYCYGTTVLLWYY